MQERNAELNEKSGLYGIAGKNDFFRLFGPE